MPSSGAAAQVVPVSALNRLARETLERSFPLMWIGGEISNLVRAPSGHIYFTLKDDSAQVRCTMWRNRAQALGFLPANGMHVDVRALVTLYEARGDFQLNVEAMREGGAGRLYEAFMRLRERLAAEGLFDATAKRPLPRYPRAIAVVTSTAAAALGDVLAALRRRAPGVPVVIYPAAVQGAEAAAALCAAIDTAARRQQQDGSDLLLLVRGGGSMEDLWPFNDETLARRIRACPIPVVSGVGHETDVTIADFAADVRAATPTAAAELASAGYHAASEALAGSALRLQRAMAQMHGAWTQRVDRAALRLVHPRQRLATAGEQLGVRGQRLQGAWQKQLERHQQQLEKLALRLHAARPALRPARERVDGTAHALQRAMHAQLQRCGDRLDTLGGHLRHLDPQAVLQRGYGIVRDARGQILRDSVQAPAGSAIVVQLARGTLSAEVTAADSGAPPLRGPAIPD
ncbi:exodeoxyribonuclease VII large subunit [Pseudothauera lacus]|uniref:Exodeoxyribonuclease 7 large subunit n=2 Tax=Pseudothauera lacus TaxID=2136175 RepID=A0A2T4IJP3_9RHOO|nr:exodeoxyribonuclease VII large subunit [Pseudothauera lacus]